MHAFSPSLDSATADELCQVLRLQVAVSEARQSGRALVADCLRGALRQKLATLHARSGSRGSVLGVTVYSGGRS